MDYQNLVMDFCNRTKKNLEFIKKTKQLYPEIEVFEVTHLINSLLGLIVFPQQRYIDSIPEKSLEELKNSGWAIPKVIGDFPQVENLKQLIRYLRNAIAHFNIMFSTDMNQQINGITVWNEGRKGEMIWKAELTITELEGFAHKFADLITKKQFP